MSVGGGGLGRGCCQRACGGHRGRGSLGCPSGRRCRGSTCTGTAYELEKKRGQREKRDLMLIQLTVVYSMEGLESAPGLKPNVAISIYVLF